MDYWYRRMPGKMLLEMEQQQLDPLLPHIPGECIVQMGGPSDLQLLQASAISNKSYLGMQRHVWSDVPRIQSEIDSLPLLPNSIDVFVVAHMLEMVKTPGKVIHELYDAQNDGGYLILLGFNPLSLWNLTRINRKRRGFPWNGHFWSARQLKACMRSVGYSIVSYNTLLFRPPVFEKKWADRLLFMEMFGQICLSGFGGAFCIIAQKSKQEAITDKLSWWERKVPVSSGCAEPTTRVMDE